MYANVELPYDLDLFKKQELADKLQPLLAHEFRISALFSAQLVDVALKIFE